MRVFALPATLLWSLLAACGNDIQVSKGSKCDGESQSGEETVDSPYDADQDGYFDASNPDCAATYDPTRLDCDDQAAEVHPTADEIACNEIDDDCDPATIDGPDADVDGFDACTDCDDSAAEVNPDAAEVPCNTIDDDCDAATSDTVDVDGDGSSLCSGDCDDNNAAVSPLVAEVCDNTIDDDCDSQIDEDCAVDYTGTWNLDNTVTYTCAGRAVNISFNEILLTGPSTATIVTPTGSGNRPGTMNGAFSSATRLGVSKEYAGGCTEDYYLDVTFTDSNHFTGLFLAQYSYATRPTDCADCENQTIDIAGSR